MLIVVTNEREIVLKSQQLRWQFFVIKVHVSVAISMFNNKINALFCSTLIIIECINSTIKPCFGVPTTM